MYDNAYNQSDSADLESEGRVMSNVINMSGGAADLQSKTVNPSTSQQVVRPDTGKDGLSQVTVTPIKLQSKTVSPSTSQQIVKPDSSYNGLSQVTVNSVSLQSKELYLSSSPQVITPDPNILGMRSVTVKLPYTVERYTLGGSSYPPASYTTSFVKVNDFNTDVTITFNTGILDNVYFLTVYCLALIGVDKIQSPFEVIYLPTATNKFWLGGSVGSPLGQTEGSVNGNALTVRVPIIAGDGYWDIGDVTVLKMSW